MSDKDKYFKGLPYSIKYMDGEEEVEGVLIIVPDNEQTAAGYYSFSKDYWINCAYGDTIKKSLKNLKKILKWDE